MARVLGVPRELLEGDPDAPATALEAEGGMPIAAKVLDRFPKLGAYLEMLNKAVALEDEALITHIGETLAEIFLDRQGRPMARVK
jgi:hypothetical protein